MKTTVQDGMIIVTADVTTTSTMADMLSSEFHCDLTIDSEDHLVIRRQIDENADIEPQIALAKELLRDMEGTMLSIEAAEKKREEEEEIQKSEGTTPDKDVDAKNMDALVQEMGKLVDDVTAGKYGPARIALFADNPTRVGYRGNMPAQIGALFAFAVANE